MPEISTKPYLIRAIYEWCTDSGYTPHIAVAVDGATQVPMQFVKNGEIVLNISFGATSGLKMDNDSIRFNARFGGVSRELFVPVDNVIAIYANENGQGMVFEIVPPEERSAPTTVPNESADSPSGISGRTDSAATATTLTAVPSAATREVSDSPDDLPEPPKNGGRPTLTRIK